MVRNLVVHLIVLLLSFGYALADREAVHSAPFDELAKSILRGRTVFFTVEDIGRLAKRPDLNDRERAVLLVTALAGRGEEASYERAIDIAMTYHKANPDEWTGRYLLFGAGMIQALAADHHGSASTLDTFLSSGGVSLPPVGTDRLADGIRNHIGLGRDVPTLVNDQAARQLVNYHLLHSPDAERAAKRAYKIANPELRKEALQTIDEMFPGVIREEGHAAISDSIDQERTNEHPSQVRRLLSPISDESGATTDPDVPAAHSGPGLALIVSLAGIALLGCGVFLFRRQKRQQ